MRTFDLSPLFRSTVGFDRFDSLFDSVSQGTRNTTSYPPYNIEGVGDDAYRVTMAVAGFAEDDIEVVAKENMLTVTGKIADKSADEKTVYLHRGLASRAFEHRFQLADHIVVEGAALENGLLVIALRREIPEELKPRSIPISRGTPQLEKQAA